MNSFESGILLSRKRLREYDEKLLFFTQNLGIIPMTAFGTLAPKSSRGKLLAKGGWLKIIYQQKGRSLLLTSLESLMNNSHLIDPAETALQAQYIQTLKTHLPHASAQPDFFLLLLNLCTPDLLKFSLQRRLMLFHLGLLKASGNFPVFTRCCVCSKTCSELWCFSEQIPGWAGENCLRGSLSGSADFTIEDLIFLNNFWKSESLRKPELLKITGSLEERSQSGDVHNALEKLASRLLTWGS